MNDKRAWIAPLLALGWLAATTMGCSRYGAYCTDKMDCERGNDADIEACELGLEHDEEEAAIWGCVDEWDSYFECLEDRSYCDPYRYYTTNNDCNYDRDDLHACIR